MRRPVNASTPRLRRGRAAAICLAAALALPLALGGCGYGLDSPRLPQGAGTIAIAAIRNRTTTGELDIRLAQLLRYRLSRHSTFSLAPEDSADVVLQVTLNDLKINRSRDLTSTNVSAIAFTLTGPVSLLDRRRSAYYLFNVQVSGSGRLDFDTPTSETPAIRDQGLTEVLNDYANSVEALLLRNF